MRKSILQFCPNTYPHLLTQSKITYKDHVLKSSYLIDLMHTFIVRKYLHKRKNINLWSVILRKKYGTHYNYYIDWLIDHKIIVLKKKWKSGFNAKSKLYSLAIDVDNKNIVRYRNEDKFLLKKINKFEKAEAEKNSPIYQAMIEDLKYINLDYVNAKEALDNEFACALTDEKSYFKNLISLESIKNEVYYCTKDEYGRLHTNFTNLKKSLRNNFLKLNGKEISSLDIKNCQPKLLAKLILEKEKNLSKELQIFIERVKDGTFYSSFNYLDIPKDEIKQIVFQVFFGKNKNNNNNKHFKETWPELWQWIVNLKKTKHNHAFLSHLLQKMESDLVYNKICTEIKSKMPNVPLFTVHDGLFFPKEYADKITPIFDKYESQII